MKDKTGSFFFGPHQAPTKEFLLQTQRDALRLIILPLSHTFATRISAAEWLRFPQVVYSLFVRFATTSLHISSELVTSPSLVDRNKFVANLKRACTAKAFSRSRFHRLVEGVPSQNFHFRLFSRPAGPSCGNSTVLRLSKNPHLERACLIILQYGDSNP